MTTTTERPEAEVTATATMPIADIAVHPHYRRLHLGRLRELQQSLQACGLLRPVPVKADGCLLAGERRLRAARNLRWESIPVIIARDDAHAVELIAAEHADEGPCRKPRSATELTLLGLQVEELEYSSAEARRFAGQRRQRAEGGRRESRDVASDIVGVSRNHYIRIRAITLAWLGWESQLGGHERIRVDAEWSAHSRDVLALVDRVCAGEMIERTSPRGRRMPWSVNAIHEEWVAERERRTGGDTSYSTNGSAGVATQRAQREALAKSLATLSGLCHGLASITEIDPATTREEAAAYHRDLSTASRTLRDLHRMIKEYANGIA
jgi:hypothetical protein